MEDLNTILGDDLTAVSKSKVLMVGAGGIGCELLKNLVQSGFKNIEIVCNLSIPMWIITLPN